ncbi:F-box/FBD/LRR-repeat protein At1g13570-like [Rutidosis leptorrhynchoides]|uniref:F-box/FBD/LRR-repeat protein At1g13570-like n=1 Tax=Rutidosis leptorrhynchoides TaxID=125765 RepID=UPI003A994011
MKIVSIGYHCFFFALRKLTNLWLTCGCIYHLPTTFNGFRSLTELNLHHVKISKKTLLHLLSSCPLLEDLTLYLEEDDILGNDRSSITDLIKCLPAIRRLVTVGWFFRCFSVHSFLQKLPISLVGLKYLHIEDMSFLNSGGLPSFFRLIQCSPNLEELSFLSYETDGNETITLKNYSNIWLKNLKEFEIYGFFELKLRLEFVKLILAKSPMLKKVYIRVDEDVTDNQVSNISRLLQHSPRASRLAKITVERYR